MSWPQWPASQPSVPAVLNPAQPIVNPVPSVVPSGAQYTPEQWAQMQQQNWNQWAQWQQQYQQWHQQYGAEYQKSMNALAAQAHQPTGLPNVAIPPPLPIEPKPPLPTEDPPPPVPNYTTAPPPPQPHQGYNTAPMTKVSELRPPVHYPKPVQNWPNNEPQKAPQAFDYNKRPNENFVGRRSFDQGNFEGNKRPYEQVGFGVGKRPYDQRNLDPVNRPYDQGNFDGGKRLHEGDQDQFNKKPINRPNWPQNQPPKQVNVEELSEAEKKFDKQFRDWEGQFKKWKEQNVEHPDKTQYREYEKKWESWRSQLLERREQMRRKRLGLLADVPNRNRAPQAQQPDPSKVAPTPKPETEKEVLQSKPTFVRPPPTLNDEPLKFKESENRTAVENENVGDFIKPNTGCGIPGLDLVKDDPKGTKVEAEDVVVLDPEDVEKENKGPDLDAISKGINSILGDQKLMNILSMVSQTQPKHNDNLTNSFAKISETEALPIGEQTNQSFDEQSNHSANHNQREFVQNFDDQTRSSFTHNEPEMRFDNFEESNKFGNNRFGTQPNRFGSNQRFNPSGDFNKGPDRFGHNRFGPPKDNMGPNQDRFGQNQERFGSNQDRFGLNHDGFGQNQDRFGPNKDNFRPNQHRFGPNKDDFGPNQDRFAPNKDMFGPNQNRFGQDQNRFGPNQDRFGPNQERFGPNQNRFGSNQDRFEENNSKFKQGPNNFGPNQSGRFGIDKQSDGFGQNLDQNRFGFNQGRFAQNQDRFGPKQDQFGVNQERFPSNQNRFGNNRFSSNQHNFEPNQEEFTENFEEFDEAREDYDYDLIAEKFNDSKQQEDQGPENVEDLNLSGSEPKSTTNEAETKTEDIFQPASVVDYEHKSLKPTEPEVLIEPIFMFDYRHKPLSRIPLPQRPKWLSDTVRNIREFAPPTVGRGYEPPRDFRRFPPPQEPWRGERYPENRHPRRPYDERPFDNRSFENRRSFDRHEDKQPIKPLFQGLDLEEEKISDTEFPDDDMDCESNVEEKDLTLFQNPERIDKCNKNITSIEDLINPPGRYKRPPRLVIILRGPPGSGKTFLAKLIKDKEVENGGSAPRILSLDDYFMIEQEKDVVEDGRKIKVKEMVYEYEAEMEESYRTSLIKSFKKTITDGYFSFIIVDNINDRVKYFGEMWSFAKQNGFQVYICQLELDVQTCSKRNIHGRSEKDIQACVANWEPTPSHHPVLDATSLLQSASIPEVEMEEVNSPEHDMEQEEAPEDEVARSKWDNFDCSVLNLAKLDGVSKPLRQRTMEEYLQLDSEWTPIKPTKPGQKRVRWADLEEQKQQEKMRAIGFVVGHTDWDRMMDPTGGSSALTKTKYIERTGRYKVNQN